MEEARLVMSWDIQDGKERACIAFMVSDFGPGLLRLGCRISDAWYTQAGNGPRMVLFGEVGTVEQTRALLATADFTRLREQLMDYAEGFACRIARPNGTGFQF
ncbi:MAG TPA: hypothetical protein VFS21_04050 [Roseiflexaceae bacterium]|nr:hypothetical protein [Roseiflexaceae bacterium]